MRKKQMRVDFLYKWNPQNIFEVYSLNFIMYESFAYLKAQRVLKQSQTNVNEKQQSRKRDDITKAAVRLCVPAITCVTLLREALVYFQGYTV